MNVDQSLTGSRDMIASLFLKHEKVLMAYCLRLCDGYREDAWDLYSDGILRALKSCSYNPARPFTNWAMRILGNLRLDQLRKLKCSLRCLPFESDEVGELLEYSHGAWDRYFEVEDLRIALKQIPKKHRALVAMVLEGRRESEIAQSLGICCGSVRSRLHRMRQELRQEVA